MIKSSLPSILLLLFSQILISQNTSWSLIANSEFEGEAIKSTLFFTGNWRNGVQFYDYNPSNNTGLFTMHPSDSRHLGWSEDQAYRDFAINTIIEAGVNVINISYWGLPGTDNWAHWSPMQSSTESHDEIFNAVLGKPVLVAPFIESFAATGIHDGFSFMDDFPGTTDNPAPKLIELTEDLINRYIVNPGNNQWPDKWAKVYDRNGDERYLISIIHVASNSAGVSDQEFAAGFDLVADKIYENTNILIGFALDILPPDNYAPGAFKATPTLTGPYLMQQSSVLAIQFFIPEIWEGESDETQLIEWKRDFSKAWINTGLPYVHDISSGYDAHIVFPTSPVYGNNQNWRDLQDSLIQDLNVNAFAFNAWNGYTEGFAGVPTAQYGDATYKWICGLFGGNCGETPEPPESITVYERNTQIRIRPNPAQDYVHVFFENTNDRSIKVSVYSTSSQLIFSDQLTKSENTYPYVLNLNDFSNGIYFLTLESEDKFLSKRIVVNR